MFQANRKRPKQRLREQPRKTLQSNLQRLLPVWALPVQASARFHARRPRTPRSATGRTDVWPFTQTIPRYAYGRLGPTDCLGFLPDHRFSRRATLVNFTCRSFRPTYLVYTRIAGIGSLLKSFSIPTYIGRIASSPTLRFAHLHPRKGPRCNPFALSQLKTSSSRSSRAAHHLLFSASLAPCPADPGNRCLARRYEISDLP